VRGSDRCGGRVPATGMASLGAFAKRIIDDGLDIAGTSAAFDAAAKAVIDLLGAARQIHGGIADGTPDIVIAEDVAGTDNHGRASRVRVASAIDIEDIGRKQKEKPLFLTIPNCASAVIWSESKLGSCARSNCRTRPRVRCGRWSGRSRPWRAIVQRNPAAAILIAQIWPCRSLIIQVKCGIFTPLDSFAGPPYSLRKVKPCGKQ